MNTGPTSRPRSANTIMRDIQRIWQLLRDPSVPGWKWLLPIGALLYWVWPVDLIPFLPFDDIAVVILAISMLLQMAARSGQNDSQPAYGQPGATDNRNEKNTIETTWRVIE